MSIYVKNPGPLTLLQDRGRVGVAHLGLSPSGALDRGAWELGNRLVGNAVATGVAGGPSVGNPAGLEILMGGLELRFISGAVVALTGAEGPVTVSAGAAAGASQGNGSVLPWAKPTRIPAGAVLKFGPPVRGLRYYLAIRGGLLGSPLFGSLSADTLAREGSPALAEGQILEVGPTAGTVGGGDGLESTENYAARRAPEDGQVLKLRVSPGPRVDWFTPGAWDSLTRQIWAVSPDSNRIGVRLLGQGLERAKHTELPSEGAVRGALQVPPSGIPTVFMADHPVTGGYPVIAVVDQHDLDQLAQARPGQPLRFLAVRP
ncbi:biotin-dependent carboxyltransferase family protein [Pseudarthrobacter sp. J1738]|uniref:5-oxoprolinase subunit C family protein n=1 Tax=unclassified Pseudarthrobacter TaxID=2647000 RepID=UPI003D2BC201